MTAALLKDFGAMETVQHGLKKSAEKRTLEASRSLYTPLTEGRCQHLAPPAKLEQLKDSSIQPIGDRRLGPVRRSWSANFKARRSKDYLLHDAISGRCPGKASLDEQKAEVAWG